MKKSPVKLEAKIMPYAYWTEATDAATGLKVPGLGANRFFRFNQPALLSAVKIGPQGIYEATEQIRADHVTIETYTTAEPKGRIVFDGPLAWKGSMCRIALPGEIPAQAVSIRCHKKHPVKGKHFGLHHPAEWTVPFDIFGDTQWFGRYCDMPGYEPPAQPQLRLGNLNPKGSADMKAWADGMFVHFESAHFKVSFSLQRPRVSHLSWDALGRRSLDQNFLVDYSHYDASGPWTLDLGFATPALLWGGSVDVENNRVIYHGLNCREGLSLDAVFEVHSRGMELHLVQRCCKEHTFLEADSWRFVWDGQRVYSLATLAKPLRGFHRNGRTEPSGGWHCTNRGTLSFAGVSKSSPVGLQTESTGFFERKIFSGFQLGFKLDPYGPVTLLAGQHEATIRMEVDNVEPVVHSGMVVHEGLRRAWGSVFAFRPEAGGLSNNSFSINCTNCQFMPADLAAYTMSKPPVPDAIELVRYTTELALKGGPQYAAQFEQAHDTAPSLVIAAGRVHQARPDSSWLQTIWPYLRRPIEYILENMDEAGMYTCRLRSGNSGKYERSCNAYDTFSFGHHDGYAGALAFRALHNAVALARDAGQAETAERCRREAQRLKEAYVKDLFNADTGWIAGWRSKDGKLHDYGFVFINAMAVCFGMLDDKQAMEILVRLEAKRKEVGHDDFRYGIAMQLLPVPREDMSSEPSRNDGQFFQSLRKDGRDTFGVFTNGGLTHCLAYFYLRALSRHGFKETADRICDQMLESFDQGVFEGCRNGAECFTWDGIRSGYEGTLTHGYHVLLAIAQHRGWLTTLDPEWWPRY